MWIAIKYLRILPLLLIALAGEAQAHHYKSCEFYVTGAPNIPRQVAELMKKRGNTAARACFTYEDKLDLYAPVSKVREGAQHVCTFEVLPIVYPVNADNPMSRYRSVPRQPGCPPQSDASYVEANDVSEGVFAALIAFTDRLCLKPSEGFGALVSPGAHDPSSLSKQLEGLCASIPVSRPLLRDWLFAVSLDTAHTPDGAYGTSAYMLQFGDFGIEGSVWFLWVDLEQGEIKANKIERTTEIW
jgi:hypothetical protein